MKFLLQIIGTYSKYLRDNADTLLPKFFGCHSVKYVAFDTNCNLTDLSGKNHSAGPGPLLRSIALFIAPLPFLVLLLACVGCVVSCLRLYQRKIYFVVMNNVFANSDPRLDLHVFDLKGSTVGRRELQEREEWQPDGSTFFRKTMKDLDFFSFDNGATVNSKAAAAETPRSKIPPPPRGVSQNLKVGCYASFLGLNFVGERHLFARDEKYLTLLPRLVLLSLLVLVCTGPIAARLHVAAGARHYGLFIASGDQH